MHVDSRTRHILIAVPSSCLWQQPPRSRRLFGPDALDAAMASNILWGHVGSVASAVLVGTRNRLLLDFFYFSSFIAYFCNCVAWAKQCPLQPARGNLSQHSVAHLFLISFLSSFIESSCSCVAWVEQCPL